MKNRIEEIKAKHSAIEQITKSPYLNREIKTLINYYYCLECFDEKDDTGLLKRGMIEQLKFMIEDLEK